MQCPTKVQKIRPQTPGTSTSETSMKTLPLPRWMQSIPLGSPILDQEVRGVVFSMRRYVIE
jgi:hypothetical protein